MRKLRAAGAALIAIMAATAASATDYSVTFNAGTFTPAPIPVTSAAASLTDTFTFTTSAISTFSGSLTTRYIFDPNANLVADLDFLSVFIDGLAWTSDVNNTDALEQVSRASTLLQVGTHVVTVNYKVDVADANNGATYGGVFNLATSDVPEPASWAMMVGGFGLMGSAMRRTRKLATATA